MEALISLAVAVMLFIFGSHIADAIVRICGIAVIVGGIVLIYFEYRNRPIIADNIEVLDDVTGELH